MKKYLFTAILALMVMLASATLMNLNGKWTGELVMSNYKATLTYNFKVDGEKLSGTVDGPDGPVPIDSGHIHNDFFEFVITPPKGHPLLTTGKYWGDSTTVDFTVANQDVHLRLLRTNQ